MGVKIERLDFSQALSAAEATDVIRACSQNTDNIIFTEHALERMHERSFNAVEVYEILRTGVVRSDACRDRGNWKYEMEVPHFRGCRSAATVTAIKQDGKLIIITVMWKDK